MFPTDYRTVLALIFVILVVWGGSKLLFGAFTEKVETQVGPQAEVKLPDLPPPPTFEKVCPEPQNVNGMKIPQPCYLVQVKDND